MANHGDTKSIRVIKSFSSWPSLIFNPFVNVSANGKHNFSSIVFVHLSSFV